MQPEKKPFRPAGIHSFRSSIPARFFILFLLLHDDTGVGGNTLEKLLENKTGMGEKGV